MDEILYINVDYTCISKYLHCVLTCYILSILISRYLQISMDVFGKFAGIWWRYLRGEWDLTGTIRI